MASNIYNIAAEQGSTFTLKFDIKVDGVTQMLSGYSARMQVRTSTSSTTKILDLVSPTNITINNSTGLITVTVSAASMAAVTAGKYVYDIELIATDGTVIKPLKGKFNVEAEVTK